MTLEDVRLEYVNANGTREEILESVFGPLADNKFFARLVSSSRFMETGYANEKVFLDLWKSESYRELVFTTQRAECPTQTFLPSTAAAVDPLLTSNNNNNTKTDQDTKQSTSQVGPPGLPGPLRSQRSQKSSPKPKTQRKSIIDKTAAAILHEGKPICTHVRRGDFQYDGVHQPSDATFTRAATDFLVDSYQRNREKRVTVVVLGNDINFAHTVFEDKTDNYTYIKKPNGTAYNYSIPTVSPKYTTVLTPTLTPEIDLAFSRLFCDVTLITAPSSTFGWWLSYLAKRNAKTYYRDIVESKDGVLNEMRQEDFYPSSWTKLWTDPSGSIRKS
ncbi:hypothetical protein CAEBREN_00473 [Caenorhabditis brenneri]|uniref:Uncharacterized protein n=1 Tax=Caenorhabditis brenneri TaxID=135651 RepID=G0MIN6_CAEBE|nr:hypothetical protein CAEBREN_00473 [Caenorhabditis brenneri]